MYLLDIVANATKYNTSLKCYATHTLANIQSHPNDDDTSHSKQFPILVQNFIHRVPIYSANPLKPLKKCQYR